MNRSTTIIAVVVQLLAVLLPLIGIEVGTEQLTTTAQTIVVIGSGLWIWKERVARGDVTFAGKRK